MGKRIFVIDQREMPDPDPNLTTEQVKQHYQSFFPELANAETKETKSGESTIIRFEKRVGVKGKR